MLDCLAIIDHFYRGNDECRAILLTHSEQVRDLALRLAARLVRQGATVDLDFVAQAAMLHDIGIIHTNAPSIHCYGNEPYICHGILGRSMLEGLGLPEHALVCERHTGAGLALDDIVGQNLPLPHRDMCPVSIEEQLICYADKFFSKTHPGAPARSLTVARDKLLRFGAGSLSRFDDMAARLGDPAHVPPLATTAC